MHNVYIKFLFSIYQQHQSTKYCREPEFVRLRKQIVYSWHSDNEHVLYAVMYYKNKYNYKWRRSATSRALDLRLVGRRFKSYSRQRCVTTLGK